MVKQEASRAKDISFFKLAETSPAAITGADENGRIIYANSTAEKVLGLQKSGITDRTYDDPAWKFTDFEGNDYPADKLPFSIVKNTEEPVEDVRHAIEWPDGERKFLSINASPMFDDDGEFDGMVSVIEDITAQVKTRGGLEQGRERYHKYFEKLGDAVFILAMGGEDHGRILEVNPTAVEQTGYSREELVGMNMIEDIALGSPSEVDYEEVDRKISRGETVSFTEKKRSKGGDEYWTEVVVSPIEKEGKQANLSINRDITERKTAKRKLKENERKYRSLFNSIRDAILVADTDRNIIDCNPAFTDLFGYELEEIEGKNTNYIYHDEDEYEDMGEEIQESIGDPNFFYTIHYEKQNGEVFPGNTNVFYLKENGGQVIGFIGLIRDVTDRLERQRKLKRSEKRYRTVFENTGTAMLIIEEDTTISLVNEEVEKLAGYPKDEIEDKMSWTKLVAREDELERMKEYHTLRREDPDSAPNQYEFKLLDKDKNEKDVLMTIDVIPGTKKSVASIIDITEEKNYEQNLQRSFRELAETTSRVLGVRDPYTHKHEQRVGELAREVGKRLGLAEDTLLGLYLGGVLHDIGKIAIPETILNKPGDLKDVEWKMIKSHPEVGYDQILEDTDFPWPVAEMTLHHHERLDGSGYPDGLEGEELTTEVRVLAAVDVVEAMSTRRPYREARSKERTLGVITEGKGNKFDPEVVDILVELIEEGKVEFGGS